MQHKAMHASTHSLRSVEQAHSALMEASGQGRRARPRKRARVCRAMESRQLGRTDLSVSSICLGEPHQRPPKFTLRKLLPPPAACVLPPLLPATQATPPPRGGPAGTMLFGEGTPEREAGTLLDLAAETGVSFFDTAEMYPVPQRAGTQGASERILGRWLAAPGRRREDFAVATTVAGPGGMPWLRGGPPALDASNIAAAIDGSLERLGTDYIDLLQLHWPDRWALAEGSGCARGRRGGQAAEHVPAAECAPPAKQCSATVHLSVQSLNHASPLYPAMTPLSAR